MGLCVVGASSFALLCSAASSSTATSASNSDCQSKFTSIPSLASPPDQSASRPLLKHQRRFTAVTDDANKHKVAKATAVKADAADPSLVAVGDVATCTVGVPVAVGVGGCDGTSSRHTVQTRRQPTVASHRIRPFEFAMPTPSSSVSVSLDSNTEFTRSAMPPLPTTSAAPFEEAKFERNAQFAKLAVLTAAARLIFPPTATAPPHRACLHSLLRRPNTRSLSSLCSLSQ